MSTFEERFISLLNTLAVHGYMLDDSTITVLMIHMVIERREAVREALENDAKRNKVPP